MENTETNTQSDSRTLFTLIELAEMAKLAVFGCLENYLFTLFCFELRGAQKSHCETVNLPLQVLVQLSHFIVLPDLSTAVAHHGWGCTVENVVTDSASC